MQKEVVGIGCIFFFNLVSASDLTDTEKEESQADSKEENKVVVLTKRNRALTEMTEETKKLLETPGSLGDPLLAIFSRPGVIDSDGDGFGEPAVRGSSPDDNAYYIDMLPAGYIFHDFGTSIFNENLIQDFTLHPAGFGARYGSATGGVFDVRLRDPRNQPLETTIDASFLRAGVMFEGEVTENQAFYLSYRKSLLDKFYEDDEDSGVTAYKPPKDNDYQGKYQWLIGDNQKLTLSITGAEDTAAIRVSSDSDEGRLDPDIVGNNTLTNKFDSQGISWQYFGDNNSILSLSLAHMKSSNLHTAGPEMFIDATDDSYVSRLEYSSQLFKNHQVTMGAEYESFTFNYSYDFRPEFCTDIDVDCQDTRGDRVRDSDRLKLTNVATYIDDRFKINDELTLTTGLRAEYQDYTKESFVHPRASIEWAPLDRWVFNAKAGSYSRFPDGDKALRKLGNPNLKSPTANHFSVGAQFISGGLWSANVDLYYKQLKKLPLATKPTDPDFDLRYVNEVSGKATGIELLVERDLADKWYGWFAVSWSKSERTNERTGQTDPYYLDTPLIANLVLSYAPTDHWKLGLRWTGRKGKRYTPIVGLKPNPESAGNFLPVYGTPHSQDLPYYSRADFRAEYSFLIGGKQASLVFDVLNVLGSKNISGYGYDPQPGDSPQNFLISGEEGIEFFPSIGFKMKF
ncbi:TonB-dependent siderophore receptor [Pleionea sp. CnH1-48]|uniref:TonB-dependent receptor plug domain-containing protein n=1 Tax=Pleionea sp. CnH1-48 TaxID=2954494 RepID=UPI002097BFFB|nr:TonB-dependent receptor [Pleionea sp. CnH1-48]MCO7224297.1 TonB-dependent receptor [Pleionea sp. CnH1-48]